MSCQISRYLSSSIIKKQIMGITGLLLSGFIISHLIGNLLVFIGADTYNKYAHTLVTNPAIYFAEFALSIIFISHIFMAIRLTIENKKARPEQYYFKANTGRGATLASSSMPYTGIILLIFLVWHICSLKYGTVYYTTIDGTQMRDLYKLMTEYFAVPWHTIAYIIGMIAIAIHTSHGLSSSFQSLGFQHPKYDKKIKIMSKVYAFIVGLGFSSLPIYFYFQGVQ